ncbi:MAG: acyltransferase [Anaerolineales bacterium]|nr:acyltransferase [Anaerolineales bacterium]
MIPGLDGLRAVAFLVLFGLHTDYLQFGWMGVQLFFVLSGYLITDILLRMKRNLPAKEYFLKFYGRRFFRIFPLYYFYIFLMLGITTWLISVSYKPNIMRVFADQIWYAIFYVYDFFSAYSGFVSSQFLTHLWSLSVEEQFYIFWPLLIFLVPEKSLKKLFLAGIIAGPIFRIALFLIHQFGFIPFRDPAALAMYPLPFSHVDAFAFGAYITRFSIPNARKQLTYLGFAIPVIGFATQYAATGSIEPISALGYPVTMPDGYQFIWAYTLLNYWFAVLIYCVIHEKKSFQFLEWSPLQYLGKISYGLYIYHFPIIWFAGRIRDLDVSEKIVPPLILLLSFLGTVAVASISYFVIEKPFLNLKDRFVSYSNKNN